MNRAKPFSPESVNMIDLLNNLPIPVVLLDQELHIVAMNHYLEAMIGYLNADVQGIHSDYVLRTNFTRKNSPFSRVLETGESITVDGNVLTLHHKLIPVRFTLSPISSQDGGSGIVAVIEDISLEQDTNKEHLPYVGGVEILGHSPQMQEIFELIPVLAQTDASVLITGETGTGKDMVAETIHKASKRAHQPFVKVNCGALPESLLESELFGHVRGAFTGATQDKPGMFRLAHRGTIFLTEIGDLPITLQIKLLSFLDDHEFFPVGGTKKIKVDVRVIAATHRSLQEKVQRESFREDLFYRLNVLRIHLPPLRERDGDIRMLLDHFLQKFDSHLGKGSRVFDKTSIKILNTYQYPGNVRELRNIVEYAANICHQTSISKDSLPSYIFKQLNTSDSSVEGNGPEPTIVADNINRWNNNVVDAEKEMIMEALRKAGGNRSKASRLLGWGRTTLWRKLKRHDLS